MDLSAVPLPEKIIFFLLAGATLGGSLFTITRRNPVVAVMSLVGTFLAIAALYATLSAHFLAILQVSVYAGAIMVLFIFVVMILNRDEISPVSWKGILTRLGGLVCSGYILLKFVRLVWRFRELSVLSGPTAPASPTFGTVAQVGDLLFREFTFPFEAISLLLLVAIVGGVTLSRSHKQEEESEETARRGAAVRAAIRPATRQGEIEPVAAEQGHGHH